MSYQTYELFDTDWSAQKRLNSHFGNFLNNNFPLEKPERKTPLKFAWFLIASLHWAFQQL